MTDDARITRLEVEMVTVMRDLTRHVEDCMEDRRETRRVLEEGQKKREEQHNENSERLRKIELKIAWYAGGAAVALFLAEIAVKVVFH